MAPRRKKLSGLDLWRRGGGEKRRRENEYTWLDSVSLHSIHFVYLCQVICGTSLYDELGSRHISSKRISKSIRRVLDAPYFKPYFVLSSKALDETSVVLQHFWGFTCSEIIDFDSHNLKVFYIRSDGFIT